jgi:hypothetical protein
VSDVPPRLGEDQRGVRQGSRWLRRPHRRASFAELDRFIAPLQKAAALLSETILQADDDGGSELVDEGER